MNWKYREHPASELGRTCRRSAGYSRIRLESSLPAAEIISNGESLKDEPAPLFHSSVYLMTGGVREGTPQDLPSIALTDHNPCKAALPFARSTARLVSSMTPSSARTYLIAGRL